MKNIQVIDGAINAAYCIYAATDREFALIFPKGQDVEFAEDLWKRLGKRARFTSAMWKRPVEKKTVRGIHGTLFYGLRDDKKKFYPTKRELEMTEGLPPQFFKFRRPGGNALARAVYGQALRLSRTDLPKNRRRIVSLLEKAADSGHARAIHALATWYLFGKGVERSYRKGVAYEQRASRLGVSEAAWNVAFACETGKGVARDEFLAVRYYMRAADLGDRDALYEIGRCFFHGIGVERDPAEAGRWFARARRAGVKEAIEDHRGRRTTNRNRKVVRRAPPKMRCPLRRNW